MTWLIVVLALVLMNALYVAAELAAVWVPRARMHELCAAGNERACRLMPVLEDTAELDRWVAGCQIGITLSSLVLGAFGQAAIAPDFAGLLVRWLDMSPLAALSTAAVVVLVVLTFVQMLLGELVPKTLALQFPTRLALWTEPPMRWSLAAFAWFIRVLNGSGNVLLRALGRTPSAHRHVHSPREIEWLIGESRQGGQLERDEDRRLRRALRLEERRVRDVMTPRAEVRTVPADATIPQAVAIVTQCPYTRLPVVDPDLDHVIGLLHARDLTLRQLAGDTTSRVRDLRRPVLLVRDDEPAYHLLARMRERRCQMGVVQDAHGRTVGLVTVSNVLDHVVGRAADEFRLVAPERVDDGRLRLPGRLRLDEAAPWVGAEWEGDAFTVGEHVMAAFGRLPRPGERIWIDDIEVEVERVSPNAVDSVLARPRPRHAGAAPGRAEERGA